jgi:hypothetical protein
LQIIEPPEPKRLGFPEGPKNRHDIGESRQRQGRCQRLESLSFGRTTEREGAWGAIPKWKARPPGTGLEVALLLYALGNRQRGSAAASNPCKIAKPKTDASPTHSSNTFPSPVSLSTEICFGLRLPMLMVMGAPQSFAACPQTAAA